MDDNFEFPTSSDVKMEVDDKPVSLFELKLGEEKEIGKNGLKKKLLKEGQDWDTPSTGDEVEGVYALFFFIDFHVCLFVTLFVRVVVLMGWCWFCSSLYWDVA